jgi:hypothetical protein
LKSHSAQERYVYTLERGIKNVEDPLLQAIDKVFKSALNYWRKYRGKGARALDISTFFRNKRGRHIEFQKYWLGKNNKYRTRFKKAWKKFSIAFSEG